MLVLTRKPNEQILIGDDIKITLVRVRGNSVRIGIEAPREMRVVRGELDSKTRKYESADERPSVNDDEVFAQASPSRLQPSRIDPAQIEPASLEPAEKPNQPRLFVGRVRCGDDGRIDTAAPLARFMSAT